MSMAMFLGRAVLDPGLDYRFALEPRKEPEHPSAIQLLEYWKSCAARGGMRMGRDIPARAVAKLLSHVAVTEPVDDWRDGRMRLVGSGLADRFGHDITGLLISELFVYEDKQMYALMLGGAKRAATRGLPGFSIDRVMLDGKDVMRNQIIVLPVQAPDSEEVWALTGTFRF
jgi:hypothetical protein